MVAFDLFGVPTRRGRPVGVANDQYEHVPEREYSDKEGAECLKEKIKGYWAERGHDVMVVVERREFHPRMRSAFYVLRSDLVDGLPKPVKTARARAA